MKNPLYFAKVLLFGEYGIIKNAMGLTMPLDFFNGLFELNAESDLQKESTAHLHKFYLYLEKVTKENTTFLFDIKSFKQDLDNGLFFNSSIPQGYGVGSSGALVAGLYDRYSINKVDKETLDQSKIIELKNVFGLMESYFHGKSSGIDPLICYLQIPLLIKSKQDISPVQLPKSTNGEGAIFLVNSGQPGETAPMVEIFMNKIKNKGFTKILKEDFIAYNDECIKAFVSGDFNKMLKSLKKLSKWALTNFKPMIPVSLLSLWEKGLESNKYYLKLCGSGGGGYVLGFTYDWKTVQKEIAEYNPELIYRF